MIATTIAAGIPGVAIDGDKIRRFAGPLIFLVLAGLFISTAATNHARAGGCAASATEIAAVLDEMIQLQGPDRLS